MADRILADPTRRKLFERETLYNLLTLPKRQAVAVKKESAEKEYSPTTYGGSSQEQEEGELKRPIEMRIKCLKVSKKVIKKDKKLADYMKTEEKRLLSASEQLNKTDRKEGLIESLMQQEETKERPSESTLQDIIIRMEAAKQTSQLMSHMNGNSL
jgi:hypothetical protein